VHFKKTAEDPRVKMENRIEAQSLRRWSTEGVDPRRALSFWIDTVCGNFLALDIDTPLHDRFSARLEQSQLGSTTANFMHAESQRVHRTHSRIVGSNHAVFVLLQLREGCLQFRQSGQTVVVGAGESVFIDGMQPYEIECPSRTSALALRMPQEWLKKWVASPERFPARLFTGVGWGSSLNAALGRVQANTCAEFGPSRESLAENIAELLALAVGRDAFLTHPSSLFRHLDETLRRRLDDPNLSPETVAGEHRMSKRSLHYAFANAGTSFVEHLMLLRMERAREILSSERLRDLPILQVAFRCGFLDPGHFARRFRRQFGLSPGEFRNSKTGSRHH